MRHRNRAKREARERARRNKQMRKFSTLSAYSDLKSIRENSPDVSTYLGMTEFACTIDKDDLFFVCIYMFEQESGKYSFNIYNGLGQLVCREGGFVSYKECRQEGDAQRLAFESGYGALPEDNSVSDTRH